MSASIRVAHVLLSLEPGGLENGVVNVINGLDATRFSSEVICLKHAGVFAGRIRDPNVAVHQLGLRGGQDLGVLWRLTRLLARRRPDIVHTRNAESFYYGALAARLAGIRHVIHSEHGRTFNDRAIRFQVQRLLSKWAQRIFAVSGQLRQDLVKHVGIPADQIDVLYNGVDTSRFAATDRSTARQALGLGQNGFVVGSVGRLVAVKNFALLAHALARLDDPSVSVLLIGEGPERGPLVREAERLGVASRFRLFGHSEQVPALLSAFDAFVLPSLSEGMSNTLLEAMAAGITPVASRVGGNAEIIRDGQDGLLFDSGDVETLASQLKRLKDSTALRATLAQSAQARVRDTFSMPAMIHRYEELYEAAMGEAR